MASLFRFESSWKAATVVGLLGLSVVTSGCGRPNEYEPPPPPKVTVACPLRQSITNYLVETGTTEATQQAEVRARVTGFLEEIRFEPGNEVSEEDILYVIEPREYQAKLAAAEAELAAREVELARGETEYQREVSLQEKNATSDRELVAAKTARDEAQAAVDLAKANLELAKKDMDETEVRALIDGRIGKTLVKVGNLVDGTQGTQLTTIVDYDPIYANFNITENQLLGLREAGANSNDKSQSSKERVKLYLQRANDTGFPFEGHFELQWCAVRGRGHLPTSGGQCSGCG
ncbi:MAG: efflux RND transporter periplasmic adaptor subunit [Pirellulaceae bacterium]